MNKEMDTKSFWQIFMIVLLLISATFVCGCVAHPDMSGLYRSNDKAIFLHEDNTFHRSDDLNSNGQWFERKGYVYLDDDTLHVITWTVDGRDLIDAKGNRWIKED